MANETILSQKTASENDIRQALNHVDAHDRETWLRMGAGIKSELGEGGFDIWDTWSQQADSYNAKSAITAWKSLKPGRVNIGSVFFEAKRAGYTPGTPYTPPSPEEQAAKAEQNRIAEEKALVERAIEAAQAKAEAQSRWDKAGAANPNHPYLVAKGISDPVVISAIRQDGNQLLVPLRQSKELVALQSIGPNGFKSFAKGSQVQGSAFLIGHPKEATAERGVLVAEGFATAASLRQATGQPVLMAVHAYNMKPVAETLKGRMPDIPVTFCADNDANGVGIKYAEQAADIVGDKARAIMPDFTDTDVAALRQKHGTEAMPSDFNDLAQIRGSDAVKQAVQQSMAEQNIPEIPDPSTPVVPASVLGQDQQNRIEPDLDHEIVPDGAEPNPAASRQEEEPAAKAVDPETVPPQAEPTTTSTAGSAAGDDNEQSPKKPILDLAYKAPPDGLEVRYLFVDGKYVDVGNGVTTIFRDKGKYLATAKEDIQTVHDMVEVAKAKGWDRLKLSGSQEFKRLMYVEAESQGIKTRGYRAAPEDLAMVNRRLEERSLNQVQTDPTQEKKQEKTQDNSRDHKPIGPKPDVQAASAADQVASQNELPTKAQIESSPKADVDSDVQMRDIGSQSIPSEVKIAADQMRSMPQPEQAATAKNSFYRRLQPGSQVRFRYMKSMADTVISYLRHDRRADAQRNFNDNMEKAVNGTTLNMPAPMRERSQPSAEQSQQKPDIERLQDREHQQDRSLER